jgi:hypothetical protein
MAPRFESRYCSTCGALMGRGKPRVIGYDEYTGKPVHETVFRCPNWGFFKFWHSAVTVDDDQRKRAQLGEGE